MVQHNGGTNVPVGAGTVHAKMARAAGAGREDVRGDTCTCRELLQGAAIAEVEVHKAAELSEAFGQ